MQESNNFYDDEIRLKDVILKIQLLKSELLLRWKVIFFISFFVSCFRCFVCNEKTNHLQSRIEFCSRG